RSGACGKREARAVAVRALHHAPPRALRPVEGHGDQVRSGRDVRLILFSVKNFMSTRILFDRRKLLAGAGAGALATAPRSQAQAVVRLDVTSGNVQPMPIALPDFLPGSAAETETARNVTSIIAANLQRSGLFAPINPAAYIEKISNSDAVPR